MRDEKQEIRTFHRTEGPDGRLFSMRDVTRATGLSRAMVLKLEKAGFASPYEVDPDTGYRSYDAFGVYKLMQYRTLRLMGLTQQEAVTYYGADDEATARILGDMRARLALLQRGVEELESRHERALSNAFSFVELPETTCFVGEGRFTSPMEVGLFTYNLTVEAVTRGVRFAAGEPLFSIRDDTRTTPSGVPDRPYRAKVCLPVEADCIPAAAREHVEVIPGCRAFSLLHRGSHRDHAAVDRARNMLWDEIDARGLRPCGPLRNIGIVAPYVSMAVEEQNYVYRFAVPVERDAG